MRKLLGTFMLAAVLAGCGGSSEPQTPKAATPTATAENESEAQHDLEGYSPGVVEYYGAVPRARGRRGREHRGGVPPAAQAGRGEAG